MNFYDLNIPYPTPTPLNPNSSTLQFQIASYAMELGYTSIAYNRIIKGIMSDKHICNIPRFPISYFHKNCINLANSAKFHRELLGIREDMMFRQFTRVTVCVDSLGQCNALNSGNAVIKSYDLVAVRPGNQVAFDHACEKAEVDLISIDFSVQLPFQIKFQSVQSALKRGIYFEIAYSPLISGVQTRTQMVLGTKLLVQWTRGKNLIFSSAAESRSDIRGPYDVANLSFVLGMSKEHAKAAMSKNCRALLLNAARKKQYYKSAIKVDIVSDGYDWDNISSSDGDLLLDDIAKSFAESFKVLKKPTSHGTQVKGRSHGIGDKGNPPLNLFAPKTTQMLKPVDDLGVDPNAGGMSFFHTPSKIQSLGVQELSKSMSGKISPTDLMEDKGSNGELKCTHISRMKDIQASDCENVVNAIQTDKQSEDMAVLTSCNTIDTKQNGLDVNMISQDVTTTGFDKEKRDTTLTLAECDLSPNITRDYAVNGTVIHTDDVLLREPLTEILTSAYSQPDFVPSRGVSLKQKVSKSALDNNNPTDSMEGKGSDNQVKCADVSPMNDIQASDCEMISSSAIDVSIIEKNVVNGIQTQKQSESVEMVFSTSHNDYDTRQNGLDVNMTSKELTMMEVDKERRNTTLTFAECDISPNKTRDFAIGETVIRTDDVLQRETLTEILPGADSQPESVPSHGVSAKQKEEREHTKPGRSRSMHLQAFRYSRKRLLYSVIFKKQSCKYKNTKSKP